MTTAKTGLANWASDAIGRVAADLQKTQPHYECIVLKHDGSGTIVQIVSYTQDGCTAGVAEKCSEYSIAPTKPHYSNARHHMHKPPWVATMLIPPTTTAESLSTLWETLKYVAAVAAIAGTALLAATTWRDSVSDAAAEQIREHIGLQVPQQGPQ